MGQKEIISVLKSNRKWLNSSKISKLTNLRRNLVGRSLKRLRRIPVNIEIKTVYKGNKGIYFYRYKKI